MSVLYESSYELLTRSKSLFQTALPVRLKPTRSDGTIIHVIFSQF
jgi:hypothetical protein